MRGGGGVWATGGTTWVGGGGGGGGRREGGGVRKSPSPHARSYRSPLAARTSSTRHLRAAPTRRVYALGHRASSLQVHPAVAARRGSGLEVEIACHCTDHRLCYILIPRTVGATGGRVADDGIVGSAGSDEKRRETTRFGGCK